MLELCAVVVHLSAEDVSEDGNDDVVGVVGGVLDDGVGQKEFDSDVFEAVGGQKEGNSVPFDDISDLQGRLVSVAGVQHLLALLHQSQKLNLSLEVIGVLDLLQLSINLRLDKVESLGHAVVRPGNGVELVEGGGSHKDDQEGGKDDNLHEIKSNDK